MDSGPAALVGRSRPERTAGKPLRRTRRLVLGTIVAVLLIASLTAAARYVSSPYRISGTSMEPTLSAGDVVLTARAAYWFSEPKRLDVVLVHSNRRGPAHFGERASSSDLFVKRIVGMPGEWISARRGIVMVCRRLRHDCKTLNERYARTSTADFGPFRTPKGSYFVLGDNRGASDDSRDWGPVSRRQIVARVIVSAWPLDLSL